MGLLDQIIGGLAGGAMGRSGGLGSMGRGGGLAGGAVAALLPVVLRMLMNRQGGGGMPGMRAGPGGLGGGGGLGGLGGGGGLGGLGGGALGGLAGMGGLGALLEMFSQKGYGSQARSWVSTGQNEPLPPEAVADVFGDEQLSAIASEAGVSPDEARAGLSELLPEVVDHFTPQGQVPDPDQLASSVDDYARRMQL